MNPEAQNGERLLRQGRAAEAVEAFGQALSADPNDWHTQAMMALALSDAKQPAQALDAAREAVRLAPGQPFAHYVLGMIQLIAGNLIDAERAAGQAIQLDPNNAEYFRLRALVKLSADKPAEALACVDHALSIDPEDTACLNLRSQLLVKLRRTGEARAVADQALASNPDSAHSHANAGWAALNSNKTKEALGHFKESLRLEPGNDWAKAGLAEALKARNPIYRVFLGLMLWLMRLDPRVRLGVIIGGYVLYRVGLSVSRDNPALAPWLWPVLGLYMVFAWMTWVGMPLADLMLRTSSYGRHALSDRQRLVSNVLGLFIVSACTAFILFLVTRLELFQLAAIQLALLSLITTGVLQRHGAPRYPLLLTGCGVLGTLMLGSWGAAFASDGLFDLAITGFLYGFVGMMWFVALGGAGKQRGYQ